MDEDYEDICGDCGCIMPDDGSPCGCECDDDALKEGDGEHENITHAEWHGMTSKEQNEL